MANPTANDHRSEPPGGNRPQAVDDGELGRKELLVERPGAPEPAARVLLDVLDRWPGWHLLSMTSEPLAYRVVLDRPRKDIPR